MRVFVTRKIPEVGLKKIRKEIDDVDVYEKDIPIPREVLLNRVQNTDGLLCLLTDEIDAEVMDQSPQLSVISNYAVGYDNIDVERATERGIRVTNTPGVLTRATAELTWSLLLATVRRVVEADKFTREGRFKGWSATLFRGMELEGRTLGILGAGRIGRETGRIGAAFGMDIQYTSRHQKQGFETETGARPVNLSTLLSSSDIVSLHVPLTEETEGLIGEEELRSMKEGSYLINTSRGQVVREGVLVEVLREGPLAGAGLDVYEEEPDLHPELPELDNVVLLPHIGSATHRTRDRMAEKAAGNLLDVLHGREPDDPVNAL